MKLQTWFMCLICLAVLPIAAPAEQKSCSQPRVVEFDPPLASPSPGLGTAPQAINNLGEVTGYYQGADAVYHAFLRTSDGRIKSFDAPNVLTGVPFASNYSFAGTGGNDIGAFSATVAVPSPTLVWPQMSSTQTVVRSQGVTVTWTGGAPNTAVVISGESAAVLGNFNITRSFFCLAPVAAQKFTVPASILLSLPATPTSPVVSTAYLGISNSSNPVAFSAGGIDLGFAAAMIFDFTGLGTGFYYQ